MLVTDEALSMTGSGGQSGCQQPTREEIAPLPRPPERNVCSL